MPSPSHALVCQFVSHVSWKRRLGNVMDIHILESHVFGPDSVYRLLVSGSLRSCKLLNRKSESYGSYLIAGTGGRCMYLFCNPWCWWFSQFLLHYLHSYALPITIIIGYYLHLPILWGGDWVMFVACTSSTLRGLIRLLTKYIHVFLCCVDSPLGVWLRLVLMLVPPNLVSWLS